MVSANDRFYSYLTEAIGAENAAVALSALEESASVSVRLNPFKCPPDLKKTGLLEDRDYEEEELQKALHDLNADTLKLLYTFARIALDDMIGKDKYKLQFNCLLNDPYAYNKALYDASVAYIDADGQIALHAQPIEFHLYEDWLCASDNAAAQAATAK